MLYLCYIYIIFLSILHSYYVYILAVLFILCLYYMYIISYIYIEWFIYIHVFCHAHITHVHAQPLEPSHILFWDSLHLQKRQSGPIGRLSSVLEGMHKEPAGCLWSNQLLQATFKINHSFLGWVETSQNYSLISCAVQSLSKQHPDILRVVSGKTYVGIRRMFASHPTLVTFAFMGVSKNIGTPKSSIF